MTHYVYDGVPITDTDVGIDIIGAADGKDTVTVKNTLLTNTRIAMRFKRMAMVELINVQTISGSRLTGEQYAYGLALGSSSTPSFLIGETWVDTFICDNLGAPSDDYGTFNRDCIVSETYNGEGYIKDSWLKGTTDGAIDTKSPWTHVRTRFGPAYELRRVWDSRHMRAAFETLDPNPATTQVNLKEWQEEVDNMEPYYGGIPFLDMPKINHPALI